MKETGILFKAEMVRARLAGLKTQTRRIIDPQPPFGCIYGINGAETHAICCAADNHAVWVPPTPKSKDHRLPCPYGGPGDLLWVKETYTLTQHGKPVYRADSRDADGFLWGSVAADPKGVKWKPSIFMPRRFSRITLEIVSVRVERLQEITENDAKAEGAEFGFWHPLEGVFTEPTDEDDEQNSCFRDGFGFIWESINGPGSWELNPYVWVIEFKEVQP